jgi:hypothetical protein
MTPGQQLSSRLGMRAWWRRRRGRRAHPAPTTLSRLLDDDLRLPERDADDQHLRGCGPCRRLLESLTRTIGGLGSLRTRASSGRADRIVAALRTASDGGTRHLSVTARDTVVVFPGWWPRLWSAVRYCLQRSQLRFTVPIGVLLGAALTVLNMGGTLLRGEIDLEMSAVCALDFVLPFMAMNVVLLGVARRR